VDCIALLGTAQRTIHVAWQYVKPIRKVAKPFPIVIKTFGDRIQVKRFEKSFTRQQLASGLGIEVSLLTDWEEDSRIPDLNEAKRLSEFLGVFALPVANLP
jgi:ribosome-binding protein aMBF1 (putative translation factor)